MALVFQDGALFNSMSVYDNLALFPRENRIADEAAIKEKVMRALQILSLEKSVDKFPSELSGGMKKRVAIARGLVMEPQLMLYDEPTSELDEGNREHVMDQLRAEAARGAIVVVATHDPAVVEAKLREDKGHEIKAVCVLHNETATGCLSPIAEIRKAIDRAGHPTLLLVDTISSLASTDYRHDEWGVDVTIGGAQKGLMLPPGMSFNAVSDKAIAASKNSKLVKSFWSWEDMLNANKAGYFPYTPATNMLQGLVVAIDMLHEEGLENVFARHDRLAEATRVSLRICVTGLSSSRKIGRAK